MANCCPTKAVIRFLLVLLCRFDRLTSISLNIIVLPTPTMRFLDDKLDEHNTTQSGFLIFTHFPLSIPIKLLIFLPEQFLSRPILIRDLEIILLSGSFSINDSFTPVASECLLDSSICCAALFHLLIVHYSI